MIKSRNIKIGQIAGHIANNRSYIAIDRVGYPTTHIIWLLVYKRLPEKFIDHIDRNSLNNKIENLREANESINQRNKSKQKNNTSGTTGVYWNIRYKKWNASIWFDGKQQSLGCFVDKKDAIAARKEAEIKYNYTNT